jgi:cobalt/nickel transport protein
MFISNTVLRSWFCSAAATAVVVLAVPSLAQAHFQELLPSADIVLDEGGHTIGLAIVFTHPVEVARR